MERDRLPWSQAVTLGCTAIKTRQQKCNVIADSSKRIQQLQALPPLLEWHPEMPTTATRIDTSKARGCLQKDRQGRKHFGLHDDW